ncbi:hypothetical protein BDN70DRAFT_459393 [Pholiota conissans]|uniref:Uncharacterized protein n=1 Tax=Pholiota conissans TaxID=109636 RepID=A0A9P5ZG46_9AGAR|nr:hypothetical protein BDN70DRAFT_459393 [Pholiota conissans]
MSSSERLQQKDYPPLVSLSSGAVSIQHVNFGIDTKSAFTAPVTEIATMKAKEGHTQVAVDGAISALSKNQHLAKGAHPPISWGLIKETPELTILAIGWDSIEAHAASYTVAPFDKLVASLQSTVDASAKHLVLKRV